MLKIEKINGKQLSRTNSPTTNISMKVLIITTGGTIASTNDDENGGSIPQVNGKDLINSIPNIHSIATVDVIEFVNIDSRNVNLEFFRNLTKIIKHSIIREDISAIIMTHGTDTMEQTAYFLQRAISSKKPLILTGAMRAADQLSPDGPVNLINSLKQAIHPEAINRGVTINFNGKIHSANYAFKCQSENLDAFSSGEKGLVGIITNKKIIWYNNPVMPSTIPHNLDNLHDVPVLFCSPGSSYRYLNLEEVKGMVIVGYGCGNVNNETYELAQKAVKNGIVVILVTMVENGGVFAEYGGIGGVASMKEIGVITANELNYWRARLSLILALSTTADIDEIKYCFI
jgi:L-asparaginase